ncbi:MAG: MBL fold metallo-hydrolase [Anaerolineae bacterium]|nr:MBL fold metallo-hydrolase [Anaerolineae bacterium]NIN99392.1 MBL fold metallo-hydrolase [Anaerolineae bacterium]NIQ82257.1 MBL fold metallo-hydrolase [Anaerolineae bacterium]
MIIERLVVGMLQSNCYIVGCDESKVGIIVDPGGDAPTILDRVEELSLTIKLIVNTHGHIDHIAANRAVKEATGGQIAIHRDDAQWLVTDQGDYARMLGVLSPGPAADILLDEGDEVAFGNEGLQVIHTPGHSLGGISLVGDGLVFCGDTLFAMGVGRVDLPGGSWETLMHSIKTRLFAMPDDTTVHTGHGPPTTIGREKRFNPWFN